MDVSAIGAASIERKLASVRQAAGISVMKKAMDAESAALSFVVVSLEAAAPSFGRSLDILI